MVKENKKQVIFLHIIGRLLSLYGMTLTIVTFFKIIKKKIISKHSETPSHTRYHEEALKCILMERVEFKGAVQANKQDDAV